MRLRTGIILLSTISCMGCAPKMHEKHHECTDALFKNLHPGDTIEIRSGVFGIVLDTVPKQFKKDTL